MHRVLSAHIILQLDRKDCELQWITPTTQRLNVQHISSEDIKVRDNISLQEALTRSWPLLNYSGFHPPTKPALGVPDTIFKIREWNGHGSRGLNPATSWMDRKQEVWVSIPKMPHSQNALTRQIGWRLYIFVRKHLFGI